MKHLSPVVAILASIGPLATSAFCADWPSWRGPEQTGFVREKAVVTSWSLEGENLLWASPVGGRTTPIVVQGRVYMNVPIGEGECLREAVVCLDANTGSKLWEHAFNVFHTDIVENRVGWSAPAADPETGLVYVHGTGGELMCLDSGGEVRWVVSLTEMFGRISGYGGRLHTPIVDEDRVIITFSNSGWGDQAKPLHRLLALDKLSGEVMWWAAPGTDPNDPTCYATPVTAVIAGRRMLIAPNGDGNVYGLDARTGERLWTFQLSKRGLNSSPVVDGNLVYVGQSEENLQTTQMGSVVCIDASKPGELTESGLVWRVDGLELGYASPAIANGRLYAVDNGANLFALDARNGQQIWKYNLGRVGKASPVVTTDGVIYVADQTGVFLILRDMGTECVTLDRQEFRRSDEAIDEIYGSAAVVDGRVYFQTRYDTYCLAKPGAVVERTAVPPAPRTDPAATGGRKLLRITPAEVTVSSDRERPFYAELLEGAKTTLDPDGLQWSLAGIAGTISADGVFKPAGGPTYSAGHVVAKWGDLEARARVRYTPRPPISVDFEELADGSVPPGWVGVAAKTKVIERDGSKVLMKLAEKPSAPFMRLRAYMTAPLPGGYTVEADLLGEPKGEHFKPDMGLVNSRYLFIMLGNSQELRLVSWESQPRVQKDLPFEWQTEVWYRARLQVLLRENDALVQAKVWPREQTEPEAWSIEMVDACPNREGSAGIYGYSTGTTAKTPGTPIYYDNIKVTRNE